MDQDNGFNDNDIQASEGSENLSTPSTGEVLSDGASNFAHGVNQGLNTYQNLKNNPALGQKKDQKNIPDPSTNNNANAGKGLRKDDNFPNKKENNVPNKNNPIPGGNNQKPDDKSASSNKNAMPKANNSEKTPPKKPSVPSDGKGGFNPKKGIGDIASKGLGSLKSKLATGNKKDDKDDNDEKGNSLSSIASNVFSMLPLSVKVMVASGTLVFVAVILILFAILAATTGVISTLSGCDSPSYTVNSADATEFLCNMRSPFNDNGYVVTGVSGWRYHPDGSGLKFHYGTDVVGNDGASQKIYAVADGVIKEAGSNSGYGNTVLIDHNGKFTTRYAHLSSINSQIKVGNEVRTGDYLGIQGNTGNSFGVHLHFEVTDSEGHYVSANPYFGYSDQGYEECVNPSASASATSSCTQNDTPKARYIGQEGFAQICGRTPAYGSGSSSSACCGSSYTSSNSGSLLSFLEVFEGGTGSSYQCKTSSGKDGYLVYNHGDKNTVGPGVTTDYLPGITVGECIDEATVEDGVTRALEAKRKNIKSIFISANLNQHQEDAMTSMAYNGCGTYFAGIAKAAEKDDLSGVWSAMKGCTNGLQGLQRRRKAEFALYVTGDYSIAESYKSKNWSTSEYDDYDSDGVIAKKSSGSSSNSCAGTYTGTSNDVLKIAIRELEEWNTYSSDNQYCGAVKKYVNACGLGETIDEYCAGFVSYVLKEAGVFSSIGLPNTTCNVGNFKKPTNAKVYDAGGSYTPVPGDLFIKVDGHGNDWGHIGFVEKVEGKTIHTIEGNTDPFSGYCSQGRSDGAGGKVGSGNLRRKQHTEAKDDITHYVHYE